MSRLDDLAFVSFGSDPDDRPRPLPNPLPPVPAFELDLVPAALRGWVEDAADGLQVPPEFCAVPAVVAAAGLIGRQVGVAMKRQERWVERCILWGALIGRPSTSKSPALRPAQKMLARIEGRHRATWNASVREIELATELQKQERVLAQRKAAKALQDGNRDAARQALDLEDAGDPPPEPRIVVNDATVEKLGELLNANPRGLVQFRDELAGWLATLDREGREGDRGFWLECWNGQGPYTCDRIGRGTVRIEAPAVSILGGIQPGKLSEYVRGAVRGGMADDGLLQRFQLAVWPDLPASWQYVDRAPNPTADAAAWGCYTRLDQLGDLPGMDRADGIDVPFLRLSEGAQELLVEYQTTLMVRLRAGGEPPHMESHLGKYPALAGRLALVLHLCDHHGGPVGAEAMGTALDWLEYLEPHARRVYAPADGGGVAAAHLLLRRRADLIRVHHGEFTTRDVYRKGWAGLDRDTVEAAVEVLVEYGHVREEIAETGGRPTTTYVWRRAA